MNIYNIDTSRFGNPIHYNDSISCAIKTPKDEKWSEFKTQACYSVILSKVTQSIIRCYPIKSGLCNKDFRKWINICKENNCVPKDIKLFKQEKGIALEINGTNYSRHQIYTTLCCYRWADQLPHLPYTIIKILEKNDKIDFFQALHYASIKFIANCNHSFSDIGMCYGSKTTDLRKSIACKHVVKRTNFKAGEQHSTMHGAIQALNHSIGSMTVKIDDILNEKFLPLYQIDPTKEDILSSFKNIHT